MVPNNVTEDWVAISKKENPAFFSEIDVLLRALDRFFNVENHALSTEDLTSKNFADEMLAVRDTILRLLGVLEVIIPESRKNAYWFQKFTESKFLSNQHRDRFRQVILKQDTPEKGLYLLYDSFMNLKGIINDLLRSRAISYMGFINIGNLVSKEIRENVFFNPFRHNINPELDTIANHRISGIVRSIQDPKLKKDISLVYLSLFRFIRFLSLIDATTRRSSSLHSSLLILILMKSEVGTFKALIDRTARKIHQPELEMLLKSVGYQFSMEGKRVFQQELKDIYRKKASVQYRGKLENAHGILKNLSEQSIVQISQFFDGELKGEQIFDSFVTKLEQSLRLREDIYMLHKFISLFEKKSGDVDERLRLFTATRNFMLYFESFTFRLLRYDDYEEFAQFFNALNSISPDTLKGGHFQKIFEKIMHFKIYLETTLRHIENRSELAGAPVDLERVESLMEQYL